jgi:hypothetical protein
MLINFQLRRLKLGSSRNYHISEGISTGFLQKEETGRGRCRRGFERMGGTAFVPDFPVKNFLTGEIGSDVLLAYANNHLS